MEPVIEAFSLNKIWNRQCHCRFLCKKWSKNTKMTPRNTTIFKNYSSKIVEKWILLNSFFKVTSTLIPDTKNQTDKGHNKNRNYRSTLLMIRSIKPCTGKHQRTSSSTSKGCSSNKVEFDYGRERMFYHMQINKCDKHISRRAYDRIWLSRYRKVFNNIP